ncbi:hypothetical protein [Photobacterium damselae]|uniref:hypothetical protein n=1 Tax=Photobacterium damselae TaxID=38293 RepID=UPI001F3B2F50|nr:hypothetical protein [Photobacterium damselae]UKA12921.1 hypothetical protein IHC91_21625 [Photobacterium damselae subsp. damselae]
MANSKQDIHKDSPMPAFITLLLALMVVGMFWALVYAPIQPEFEQVIFLICGAVLNAFGMAMSFWLGNTKQAADQAKLQGVKKID